MGTFTWLRQRPEKAETAEIVEGLESVKPQADQNVELTVAQTIDTLARSENYGNQGGY